MKTSFISQKPIQRGEEVKGREIRDGIVDLIRSKYPDFKETDYISLGELNHFRRLFITRLSVQEKGDLAAIDQDVMNAIQNNSILSEKIYDEQSKELTVGQKLADKIAYFGGSWTFIMLFFSFLLIWMSINIWVIRTRPFDPYPFILLNLILSCIAAIQAPIIMMSQNRKEEKDRKQAENDYKINLKAELEIQLLNEKIDHLLIHQNQRMLEIQEVQLDYLEDLMKNKQDKGGGHPDLKA